jgi:superfamily II DNA/RNA helicase
MGGADDRFKSSKNGILIATDVAARGLDIPLVDHVIHFNLPRTADAYIHRSGRTARAQNPGFALLLCSAEEKTTYRGLMKSLHRGKLKVPWGTTELISRNRIAGFTSRSWISTQVERKDSTS